MAASLLHLLPSAGGLLRAEHVCRSCGGELSPVSRGTGEGRKGKKGSQAGKETREEEKK